MSIKQVESTEDRVVITVELHNIDPLQAFQYWIKPQLLLMWWPQDVEELTPKAGGTYHFGWPANDWHLRGMYTTVEAGSALGFTWKWDHEVDLPERIVSVRFEREDDGVLLTVTHGLYSDSEADQADRQSHIDGWTFFLGRLHTVVSRR